MKHCLARILACCLLLPALFGCAGSPKQPTETDAPIPENGGITLFVSPDGNDGADGTMDAPLASLAGAKEKVRALLPTAESPITVYFRGGEYAITEDAVFTAEDSGTADAPITYTAYPGENVSFSGGVRVPTDKVAKVTDDGILSRILDDTARGALMQADLSDLTDALPRLYTYQQTENDAYYPVAAYIGDSRLAVSRWPNSDGLYGRAHYVSLDALIRGDDDPDGLSNNDFLYSGEVAERFATWSDESLEDLYLEGWFVADWFHDRFDVTSVNREEQSFHTHFGTTPAIAYYYTYNRVNFTNLLEEIDVPGESYTDTERRVIYFYPTENFGTDPFVVGLNLVSPIVIDGASHLVFEGLTLEYFRQTPIRGENATDVTIRDCVITHTAAQAIRLFDSTGINIDGCVISDLMTGAITLTGGDRKTLTSSGNVIQNCDIFCVNCDGISFDQETYERMEQQNIDDMIYFNGCGYTISHNRLHNCPQAVLHFLANDVVIEYNEIYDCVWETSDNGAIGYNRNASELGVVIRYNFFHDIYSKHTGVGQFAFYGDDGVIGPQIYGNLFVLEKDPAKDYAEGETYHELSPILLNGAQYTQFFGNVVAGYYEWGVRFNSWSRGQGSVQGEWAYRLFDWVGWKDNLLSVDALSETWRTHYDGTSWAHLYDIYTAENLEKFRSLETEKEKENFARSIAPYFTNEVTGNVFVGLLDPPCEGGMNMHDNYESDNLSVFTDFAGADYTFTEEALAAIREVCPDFTPLSLDEVGPQK